MSDHTIVIKPADKGGATVIMNRDDYVKEGMRQLADSKFYKQLESDPTDSNNRRINHFINSMKINGEITPNLEQLKRHAHLSYTSYLKSIKTKPLPQGDPSCQQMDVLRERSALVDIFLRPHLTKIKCYLKGNLRRISSYTWLFAKNTG